MTHLKLQKLQKGDITQQHIKGDVLVGNHLFVIFAVLDVSFAVSRCLNHSFFIHFIKHKHLTDWNRNEQYTGNRHLK